MILPVHRKIGKAEHPSDPGHVSTSSCFLLLRLLSLPPSLPPSLSFSLSFSLLSISVPSSSLLPFSADCTWLRPWTTCPSTDTITSPVLILPTCQNPLQSLIPPQATVAAKWRHFRASGTTGRILIDLEGDADFDAKRRIGMLQGIITASKKMHREEEIALEEGLR